MSQLPTRRLSLGDLPSAPSWMQTVVSTFNLFNQDALNAVNGRLTIGDNLNGQVNTVSFVTPANYAAGGFPAVSFQYKGKFRPSSLILGDISQTKPIGTILLATSLQWSYNNNVDPPVITVTYVAGLAPSQQYSATFIAL